MVIFEFIFLRCLQLLKTKSMVSQPPEAFQVAMFARIQQTIVNFLQDSNLLIHKWLLRLFFSLVSIKDPCLPLFHYLFRLQAVWSAFCFEIAYFIARETKEYIKKRLQTFVFDLFQHRVVLKLALLCLNSFVPFLNTNFAL